ncbi:MAG: V-type ATPase subunit [Candidatus Thermoplasmatota archaeon]|nr:V-type ATPase subunit [Candidatus Thermoplasmatota archaeon]
MIIILDVLFNPNSPYMWLLIIGIIAGALAIIIRPFATFAKFAYPNAKFESIGNPFVKETNLQRYLDLSDLQQFIDQLNTQKDYNISETITSRIQTELDHQFVNTIHMMKQDSTKKMQPFYDTYLELIDANLLKTALKQHITENHIDENLSDHAVSSAIKKHLLILSKTDSEEILAVLNQLQYPDYITSLITAEEKKFSSFALDAAVDTLFITQLKNTKVPYKCTEAKDVFIKRMIDIRTIKHLLRAKHLSYDADHCEQLLIDEGYELAFWKQKDLCTAENTTDLINKLEGTQYYTSLKNKLDQDTSKIGSVQPYTDAIDLFWLHLVKNISTAHYSTMGPSLRFLEYKQIEIRNLKIIAKGIAEKMPSTLISPLLITEETT